MIFYFVAYVGTYRTTQGLLEKTGSTFLEWKARLNNNIVKKAVEEKIASDLRSAGVPHLESVTITYYKEEGRIPLDDTSGSHGS